MQGLGNENKEALTNQVNGEGESYRDLNEGEYLSGAGSGENITESQAIELARGKMNSNLKGLEIIESITSDSESAEYFIKNPDKFSGMSEKDFNTAVIESVKNHYDCAEYFIQNPEKFSYMSKESFDKTKKSAEQNIVVSIANSSKIAERFIQNADKFSNMTPIPDFLLLHVKSMKTPASDIELVMHSSFTKYIQDLVPEKSKKDAEKQVKNIMESCAGVEDEFGPALMRFRRIFAEQPDLWDSLIYPTITSQKKGAPTCLSNFKVIYNKTGLKNKGEIDLLRYISTQLGIKADDVLSGFISEVLEKGGIESLKKEHELIHEFLEMDPIPLIEIYETFKIAKNKGDPSGYEELIYITKALQKKIANGECEEEDYNNRFFPGVTMYAFPSAIGANRKEYADLISQREDHQKDVPDTLNDMQGHVISIEQGGYSLKEGENINLQSWNPVLSSVKNYNEKSEKVSRAELGRDLAISFSSKRLIKDQREFLNKLYSVYKGQGYSLENSLLGYKNLMAYREYVGNSLNDIIGLCIDEWQKEKPDEYKKWQEERSNGNTMNMTGLAKQLTGILKNDNMDESKKDEVVKRILKGVGIQAEGDIVKALSEQLERGELKQYLSENIVGKNSGDQKIALMIRNGLLGKEYSNMYKEMKKYEFSDGAEKVEYKLYVTKKKEHGCAGHNMGVCVASDEQLWEKPNFMNVILEKDSVIYGGMHFLIAEEEGRRYLTLPGINPNEVSLSRAFTDDLYDKLIEYAKKCAVKMGCEKVLIPTNPIIHSSRGGVQSAIEEKGYNKFIFKEKVQFSHSPEYSFQDCYEVE